MSQLILRVSDASEEPSGFYIWVFTHPSPIMVYGKVYFTTATLSWIMGNFPRTSGNLHHVTWAVLFLKKKASHMQISISVQQYTLYLFELLFNLQCALHDWTTDSILNPLYIRVHGVHVKHPVPKSIFSHVWFLELTLCSADSPRNILWNLRECRGEKTKSGWLVWSVKPPMHTTRACTVLAKASIIVATERTVSEHRCPGEDTLHTCVRKWKARSKIRYTISQTFFQRHKLDSKRVCHHVLP